MQTEVAQTPTSTQPGNKAIAFLMGIMFLNGMGFTVIGPVLPFIVNDYIARPEDLGAMVGWLTAAYAICQVIAAPVLGMLSDRYGRRPLLLICLIGSAIGYAMFGIGGSLAMLFASRIIDGLTGGNYSIAFAYIADTTSPEERPKIFGRVGAVAGVSFIVGPVVGGLAAKISLSAPLYLAAGLTVVALIWGYFFLPESYNPNTSSKPFALRDLNPFAQVGSVMGIKALRPLLLLGVLYAFPFAVLTTNFGVLIIDSLHWDATGIGLAALAVGITDIVVQGWLIGKLLKWFSSSYLIAAGLVCQAVAYGLFGLIVFIPSPLALIIATALFALGGGLVEPPLAGLTSQAVAEDQQGIVNGASQALQALTRIVGPLWLGFLYTEVGHAVPYLLNIGFVGIGILTVLIITKRLPQPLGANESTPA